MADVKYVKQKLLRMLPLYEFIRACMSGPRAIYDGREKWLPHPEPASRNTPYGKERYEDYITRARFYNVTGNTIAGMHGQVFARDPVIVLPTQLNILEEDATGTGVGLVQQARDVTMDVIGLGRHAIIADHTGKSEDVPVTQADVDNGKVRPYILNFKPEDVVNWREALINGRRRLSLLVVRETYDKDDENSFGEDVLESYREMRLIDGKYAVRIWRDEAVENTKSPLYTVATDWVFPTKSDGQMFDEIPAVLIGADNNDPDIDDSPMADIADINLGHYQNSADYEEAVHMVGQPTPVFVGLNQQWIKEVFKDGVVYLGSREAVLLPKDAAVSLLQPDPNNMAKDGMEHKEKQMVALGARLVQDRTVQRTAAEYSGDRATQTSVLATIAGNVSAAYIKCLGWVCEFAGVDASGIEFELNTDYDLSKMSPEDVRSVIESWQAGAISYTEMRFALKKGGHAYQEDEEAREENENAPAGAGRGLDLDDPETTPPRQEEE